MRIAPLAPLVPFARLAPWSLVWAAIAAAAGACGAAQTSVSPMVESATSRYAMSPCARVGKMQGATREEIIARAAHVGATHILWGTGDAIEGEAFRCENGVRDDWGVDAATASRDASETEGVTQTGTCFFVSPSGQAVTSLHVVDGATKILVYDAAGHRATATVARKSRHDDLVLLEVAGEASPAYLGIAERAAGLGDRVFTIGFPVIDQIGFDPKFTEGSVSALRGLDDDRLLQISVPVQPGNSGGPLVDVDGHVVGVIAARLDDVRFFERTGQLPQSIEFAMQGGLVQRLLRGLDLPPVPPATDRAAAIAAVRSAVCLVAARVPDVD